MIDFDNIDYEELQQIPLPEGIEERLSDKISQWAANERQTNAKHFNWGKVIGMAASVAIIFTIGLLWAINTTSSKCYTCENGITITEEQQVIANMESTMESVLSDDFPDVEQQLSNVLTN